MYSSRSRFTTEKVAEMQRLRGAMRRLIARLPESLRDDPDLRALGATLHTQRVDIVHLIYRQSAFESESKDYEFLATVDARPLGARRRTTCAARNRHPDWMQPSTIDRDVTVYDLAQGYDAAPSSSDEPDHAEKVALVEVSKMLATKKRRQAPRKKASTPVRRKV